jgi:hypothetical protein
MRRPRPTRAQSGQEKKICELCFALDMEKMVSFVVTNVITVFPYCVIDYYHLRFEVDIGDYEDTTVLHDMTPCDLV